MQCGEAIDSSADGSLKSLQLITALVDELQTLSADRQHMLEALESGSDQLTMAAETLHSDVEEGLTETHAELMRTAWDIQELAGNFEESLSRHQINREETHSG